MVYVKICHNQIVSSTQTKLDHHNPTTKKKKNKERVEPKYKRSQDSQTTPN